MTEIEYRGRRAVRVENEDLRVTLLVEGGHVAEILDKRSGVNPLWTPPWPSIEPSRFDLARHGAIYGTDAEAKLLSGIMGHNLCLDLFGGPTSEEAAAGITTHGDFSVLPYRFEAAAAGLLARAVSERTQLAFEREIRVEGSRVFFRETVENLSPLDRPLAWTQHVTLGPPFLEKGRTRFRASATRSMSGEIEFAWPHAPAGDLSVFTAAPASGGISTHLMDPAREQAFFLAWAPESKMAFGYTWRRADFPWLARWEENNSRRMAPWEGRTLTCGMEFGASPWPESRRAMIGRGSLFGVPGYRWLPARSRLTAEYRAFLKSASEMPEDAL